MAAVVRFAGNGGREADRSTLPSSSARILVREPEVAELRAFCAAATLGSIAAAARSLHVSQPALSKRLRQLESLAGVQLFDRSTRGVTLTSAGNHLYGAARRLLMSADSVKALMASEVAVDPVRIGATSVIAEYRLPQVLGELAAVEVALAVEVMVGNSQLVREMLRSGRCDLGIVALDPDRPPEDGLRGKVLWRDEVVVAVPPGHHWRDYDEIPVHEFAQTELIQSDPAASSSRLVGAALDHVGLTHAPPFAALGSPAAMIAAAIATGRPALVSMMGAHRHEEAGLEIRRVEGLRFDREFALLWRGSVAALGGPVQTVAEHFLGLPFARSRRTSAEFRPPPAEA